MGSLTRERQELVARHIRLVHAIAERQLRRMSPDNRRHEAADLVQEGMLGLIQAAGCYGDDGGPFPAYATPFIHGAICRYLLRQMDGLAMPSRHARTFVRQRRQADLAGAGLQEPCVQGPPPPAETPVDRPAADRPARLPRFLSLDVAQSRLNALAFRQDRQRRRDELADGPVAESLAVLHARYEEALAWASARAKAVPIKRIDHEALVEAVVQERLLVPRPEWRASLRGMARRFSCTPQRVWNIEMRLLRLARQHLAAQGASHEAASIVCPPAEPVSRMGIRSHPVLRAALLEGKQLNGMAAGR